MAGRGLFWVGWDAIQVEGFHLVVGRRQNEGGVQAHNDMLWNPFTTLAARFIIVPINSSSKYPYLDGGNNDSFRGG